MRNSVKRIGDIPVNQSREYAKNQGVDNKVSFKKADALSLPFEDNSFDAVWCSNVTSFISDQDQAISEYLRVLKTDGILIVVPIYYLCEPPEEIVKEVSNAIGAQVIVKNKNDWKKLFESIAEKNKYALELFYEKNFKYIDVKDSIESYIDLLMSNKTVASLSKDDQIKIRNRAKYFYNTFNKNLQYAGYSILLYQKRNLKDEVELFLTQKV